MGKYIMVTDYDLSYKLRRYVSDKKYGAFYMTEINLRENHFEIFYSSGSSYFSYLRLYFNPKKVLDRFGYSLDDFLKFENVEEFLEQVAEHLKVSGNNIHASCSRYFISDFDIELL